jgi:hypothetical protein
VIRFWPEAIGFFLVCVTCAYVALDIWRRVRNEQHSEENDIDE